MVGILVWQDPVHRESLALFPILYFRQVELDGLFVVFKGFGVAIA
jgi:hypothetical protein